MKVTSLSLMIGVVVVVALTASPLYATPISIGQTVVPTGLTEPVTPVTTLASANGTFNFDSGALTGSWVEFVVVDPFGIFCAQCLDFVIQFEVDAGSTEAIRRAGLLPFGSFLTDVNYLLETGVAPGQVLDGTIGTMSFFFTLVNPTLPGQQPVGPGQLSAGLIIATNATAYRTAGSLGFDVITAAGDIHSVPVITGVLTPTAVPEPATLTLIGTGLLAVARRRLRGHTT